MPGVSIVFKDDQLHLSRVEVHEQRQSTNVMEPRTRGAIALLPTGNRQGTWTFLAFDTGGFINRDHGTTMPMPDAVIAFMNQQALNQKWKISSDPVFFVGELMLSSVLMKIQECTQQPKL